MIHFQGEILKKFEETKNFFDNAGEIRSIIYFKIKLNRFL